eukprot:TRINITY_DN16389_c0_g1_i3.p1 TRINITY_DN16389_c0_g1~~TRINITY_DN16389_c0_g1_i3.p1  ORF type:complete len:196 (-),score=37.78 TRINITY_DN16389_c0_g1_i3:31-558(-)
MATQIVGPIVARARHFVENLPADEEQLDMTVVQGELNMLWNMLCHAVIEPFIHTLYKELVELYLRECWTALISGLLQDLLPVELPFPTAGQIRGIELCVEMFRELFATNKEWVMSCIDMLCYKQIIQLIELHRMTSLELHFTLSNMGNTENVDEARQLTPFITKSEMKKFIDNKS